MEKKAAHEYRKMSVSEFFKVEPLRKALPEKYLTNNIRKHVSNLRDPVANLHPDQLNAIHRSLSLALYARGEIKTREYNSIQSEITKRMNALLREKGFSETIEAIPWGFRKEAVEEESTIPLYALHGKRQKLYDIVTSSSKHRLTPERMLDAVDRAILNQTPRGASWHGTIYMGPAFERGVEPKLHIDRLVSDIRKSLPSQFPDLHKAGYSERLHEKVFELLVNS